MTTASSAGAASRPPQSSRRVFRRTPRRGARRVEPSVPSPFLTRLLDVPLRRRRPVLVSVVGVAVASLVLPAGCISSSEYYAAVKEADDLKVRTAGLERELSQKRDEVADLQLRIETLKGFDPKRPIDLFAPVTIEIADLTGGADYDGRPGDDGVTVHLRPIDADGHVVKSPGRIEVQLLDNSDLENPRVLGTYTVDDPRQLSKLWHGRWLTNHYTLRCPISPDIKSAPSRRVTVSVRFVDYLTGRTISAVKEVSFNPGDD